MKNLVITKVPTLYRRTNKSTSRHSFTNFVQNPTQEKIGIPNIKIDNCVSILNIYSVLV